MYATRSMFDGTLTRGGQSHTVNVRASRRSVPGPAPAAESKPAPAKVKPVAAPTAQKPATAKARTNDPATSHKAAARHSEPVLRETKRNILAILRASSVPLSDEQIYARWKVAGFADKSESNVRSRRKELVDAGMVADSGGRTESARGGESTLWKVATDANS